MRKMMTTAIAVIICLSFVFSACSERQDPANDSSVAPDCSTGYVPEPVTVECDEEDYSSYLLPVREEGDGELLEEAGTRYALDGTVHLRVYDSTGVNVGETIKPKELYVFSEFISLAHGDYDIPYLFRGGKELKIIAGAPGEIEQNGYYVTSPAVFGAFEDIILSLDYAETADRLKAVQSMIYVAFDYNGQTYYVFRDGTAWCGDRKSERRLTGEEFVLFAAYKYAYSYAAAEMTDGFSGFSTEPGEYNTVVIIENAGRRSLTGDAALEFLKKYAPDPDRYGFCAVSSRVKFDVNCPNSYGDPVLRFAVCRAGEENIDENDPDWYSVLDDGTLIRRGSLRFEREYLTGVFEELVVPLVQVSQGPKG